jgi:L-ascorbate metabolism protein UlaG (beta-lactamase superfamily)
MARILAIFAILGLASAVATAQATPSSVTLTWLGQSTFVMTTNTGLKVLLDPTNPGAYNPPPVEGVDAITVSHEHGDHNYIQMATGAPQIIRGLAQGDFAKIDQTLKGVRIRTVAAYHDADKGSQRGKNAIFIFELPGLRIVHLGDLGHKLDPEQVAAIGAVDILMTPVAGGPTVDAKTAVEVIEQLKAKVMIPMHYSTAASAARTARAGANAQAGRAANPPAGAEAQAGRAGNPPAGGAAAQGGAGRGPSMSGVDEFLKVLDPSIKVEQAAHQITLTAGKLPAQRTVMVMKYE